MNNPDIDKRVLDEFLELGGEDMRQALLAQVCKDLTRCHEALDQHAEEESTPLDMAALCRTAHEIKGIAATIGAVLLAKLAQHAETACSAHDEVTLQALLPDLRNQTGATARFLAELAWA
ncbi:MAG: Hpt domain-containing protein [Rhodobacteraceae bacterium]|nr:Hpt domain-containing protein [Paracoccaceae bacterium]